MLSRLSPAQKEEWLLRLWCAKEAVAKAIGQGIVGSPLNLVGQEWELESGKIVVELGGEMARQLPAYAPRRFTVHTGREGDLVFASALV
ncbi:MAG: 4'-phosphopantetheinyl transferase superfamily protein [Nitrospinota bacterium]|nr:MAG: 4'-phosphopantetheinyl transferase superfamily protein [Nitrospinota bacterium]